MPGKKQDHEGHGISRRALIAGGASAVTAGALLPGLIPYRAQGSTLAPAGTPAGVPLKDTAGTILDFTDGSAALQADTIVHGACQFCNANCRLTIGLKANRVIEVRGEPADPVQNGFLCFKGPMMVELAYNPLRLTSPLRRISGAKGDPDSKFEAISWDQALDIIAAKFLELRDQGEARAIANRTTGRMARGSGSLVSRLFTLLGSPNYTDVGPVCNDAGGDALAATFGLGNFTNGYGVDPVTGKEDLGSAKFILMMGTNQAETHPVTFDYMLRSRQQTGAKLVVVDPRRTATGTLADEWVAPKPHTDFALILGMLHEVITSRLYDQKFIDRWVLGFAELRQHILARGYTPEWAAGVTGLDAAAIRRLAREYATSHPAAIFCNAGISHQLGAFDTYRAIAMLVSITGNIGVPGGGCNFMHNTWPGGLDLPPLTVKTPPVTPALPVGPDEFATSILTGRPYQLRAVVTEGNPLISSAHTGKVKEAYAALEFYVYTGLFMEEAAYYADVVLPVVSGLEFEGVYMRRDDRGIRWQEPAVPPVGQARSDPQIWISLAHAMARLDTKKPPSYWGDAFPLEWLDYKNLWDTFVANTPGVGGMTRERMQQRTEPLRWPCPTVEHPGVSTLYLNNPSWYQAAESLSPSNKGKRFLTPSGKVEIYTSALEAKLAPSGHHALPIFFTHPDVTGHNPTIKYLNNFVTNPINPQALAHPVQIGVPNHSHVHREFPLMGMSGRPSVAHFATVTHWTYTGEQLNGIRLVQIHPDTAQRYQIADGDTVIVESPSGQVTGTALLWPEIRPDTIFVPNTFGPAQEVGDIFGDPRYAATNTLVNDGYYDNLSGQQAYKCYACRVRKAS
jgi:anaerobic selenocysteine-containing dehydrogenase